MLLLLLAGGLTGVLVMQRSLGRSAWNAEAAALENDTRTATGTQLPLVLAAETPAQLALSWPPLRAGLGDLVRRWDLLAQRASGEQARDRSLRIRGLLDELVAAVDAEYEAQTTGRDRSLLRPRVDEIRRALSAALADGPGQGVAAGG